MTDGSSAGPVRRREPRLTPHQRRVALGITVVIATTTITQIWLLFL